jgi:hypothetical protein
MTPSLLLMFVNAFDSAFGISASATRNFLTRTDRLPDDELCARCNSGG